jgi:hypothetical protein
MHNQVRKPVFFSVLVTIIFTLLCVVPMGAASAQSSAVTLSFDSLPSAQGWVYSDDDLPWLSKPETALFSLVDNHLHMDSRFGIGTDGAWGYKYFLPLDANAPFSITVDARVTDTDRWSPSAFAVYAIADGLYYGFSFTTGPDTINIGDNSVSAGFDVTQFHEYELRAIPGVGVDLYVDGNYLGSGATSSSDSSVPFLYIGDGTRGGDAVADIASYTYAPSENCFIDAPASVYEGQTFTSTVRCDTASEVYGFQLGTSSSGAAAAAASSYTAGTFVTDVAPDYLEGSNTLSNYSVSRRAPAAAASGELDLASLDYTASTGLTANSSATLSLDNMMLGDITGAPVDIAYDETTTITVLDLLTLNLTVASDGSVQQVRNVTASVDSENRGPQTATGSSLTFNFSDVITSSTPVLTADMKSHLVCSGSLNLTSSVTNKTIHLDAGDVVLSGSDASARINLFDAVSIGLAFGSAGAGEEDVNGDGTVNIFDLIHVGRNYGAVTGACS